MTLNETITAAVNDILEHGFDSQERVDIWMVRIREAARASLVSEEEMTRLLQQSFATTYARMIQRGGWKQYHPSIAQRFTPQHVSYQTRDLLTQRVMASANLIRRNREEAISNTLRRFEGWSTSIPIGGSDSQNRRAVKTGIVKSMRELPWEERRVLIDQGHKFTASLNDVIAKEGGAIAAQWHSHYRQAGYNYRKDHKERDGKWYLIRDSWAHKLGLVKPGAEGYFDKITQPGEEVFCRCYATYAYSLAQLPDEMVTEKGREYLKEARRKAAEYGVSL